MLERKVSVVLFFSSFVLDHCLLTIVDVSDSSLALLGRRRCYGGLRRRRLLFQSLSFLILARSNIFKIGIPFASTASQGLWLLLDPCPDAAALITGAFTLSLAMIDSLLLEKVLKMDIMALEVLDQSHSLRFDLFSLGDYVSHNSGRIASDLTREQGFGFHREDRAIDSGWQSCQK